MLPEGLGVLDADGSATEAVDDVDDNPLCVGHDDGCVVCLDLEMDVVERLLIC